MRKFICIHYKECGYSCVGKEPHRHNDEAEDYAKVSCVKAGRIVFCRQFTEEEQIIFNF